MGIIQISGTGTIKATPDSASMIATVITENSDSNKAIAENNTCIEKIRKGLENLIDIKEYCKTASFYVSPVFQTDKSGSRTNKITGTLVTHALHVTVINLNNLGSVLGILGNIQNGRLDTPQYFNSNADKLKDEARSLAIKEAVRLANLYTNAVGMKVVSLLECQEQYNSFSGGGHRRLSLCATSESVPIEVSDQNISITVDCKFEIDGTLVSVSKARK